MALIDPDVDPPRRGIYVCSRASIAERAMMWRYLHRAGWPIISSWIYADGPGVITDYGAHLYRCIHEAASAERVIVYAEPGDAPFKFLFAEVGAALISGVPVVVVAPGVKDKDLARIREYPGVHNLSSLEDARFPLPEEQGALGSLRRVFPKQEEPSVAWRRRGEPFISASYREVSATAVISGFPVVATWRRPYPAPGAWVLQSVFLDSDCLLNLLPEGSVPLTLPEDVL